MTVTAFQRRVVAAYVRDHNVNEGSAVRQVKRWFSEEKADQEFRPRGDWRRAIREVLGVDPFEGSPPLAVLERRLEELVDALASAQESRNELLENLERRLRSLEHGLARLEDESRRRVPG